MPMARMTSELRRVAETSFCAPIEAAVARCSGTRVTKSLATAKPIRISPETMARIPKKGWSMKLTTTNTGIQGASQKERIPPPVMNPRTSSTSRKACPPPARLATVASSTERKIAPRTSPSNLMPARTSTWVRSDSRRPATRNRNTARMVMKVSVRTDRLDSTRSYTCSMYSGLTSARMLMKNEKTTAMMIAGRVRCMARFSGVGRWLAFELI